MDFKNLYRLDLRFKATFELFRDNFWKYLLYNLVVFFIRYILSFIIAFTLAVLLIPIVINIWFSAVNEVFVTVALILILVIIGIWIIGALFFLFNFYLTKNIIDKKEIGLWKGIKWMFANIWNKLIVDMWYGLYMLIPILILFFGFSFASLIRVGWGDIVANLLIWLSVWLALGVFIYLITVLSFSSYHCFEKNSFSLSTFKEVFSFTKGKFWQIFGNILFLSILFQIIYLIISSIFQIFGVSNFESYIQGLINQVDFDNISTGLNMNLIWIVVFGFLYYMIQQIIKLIFDIFYFIYWYIYYKYLISSYTNGSSTASEIN